MTELNGHHAATLGDGLARKHADDLRQMWQGRLLAKADGHMAAVVLSVLDHSYHKGMAWMLAAVFPGFSGVRTPFYVTPGRIAANGMIVAKWMDTDGVIKVGKVFDSEAEMQGAFRRLADELKLSDRDRVEMFKAVKAWIVADWRAPADGPELAERLH